MSMEALNWALAARGLDPEYKLILIGLAAQADAGDIARNMPVQRIADFIERAPSTTSRYLRGLERAGRISRLAGNDWQLRRGK